MGFDSGYRMQSNGGNGRWIYWIGVIILIIAVIVSLFPHSKQAEDLTSADQHNISRSQHLFLFAFTLILVALYVCSCDLCKPQCSPKMYNSHGMRAGGSMALPGFKVPQVRT